MVIANLDSLPHAIRVQLPDGTIEDVGPSGLCGLRRALRVAGALAGWLDVDEWESASRFVPEGVRGTRETLRASDPDLDLAECTVQVARPATGPGTVNGYLVVAEFEVGGTLPALLKQIRAETGEAGWRVDAGHRAPGPKGHAERVTAERNES